MRGLTEGVHSRAAIFSVLLVAGARVSIDNDDSLSRNSPSRLWIESLASSTTCFKIVRLKIIEPAVVCAAVELGLGCSR